MITVRLQKRLTVTIMGFVSVIIALLIITINMVPTLRHSIQIENYMDNLVPDGGVMPPPPDPMDRGNPEGSGFHPEPPWVNEFEKFLQYDALVMTFSQDGTFLHAEGDSEAFDEAKVSSIIAYIGSVDEAFGNRDGVWYLVRNVSDGRRIGLVDDSVYFSDRRMYILISVAAGAAAWFIFLFFVLYLVRRLTAPVEEAFRKQKQFTADAGHELRTPLAIIKANAEVLRSNEPDNKAVGFIISEADRMAGLTEELVALAVIDDSSRGRNRSDIDIGRAVEAEVLAFESLAYEHGMSIRYDIDKDLVIKADAADISKLSSILLSNAVKYGSSGGSIEVTVREERHKAVISVWNTGEGVSADELPHLFDRFYRLDSARNSESRSYGLGLSIAAAIADDYGGTISAESRQGEWMRFTITLPLR